jgi:nickel/cobalt transporter (NiCoT) family protein
VIITSILVAASAAAISERFDTFSLVGGIIGSSVSAAFLIILGLMNGYIMWKLILQLQKLIEQGSEDESPFDITGGGLLFRCFRRMFKFIDR